MTGTVALAVLCSAGVAWMLTAPSMAARRLGRALVPQDEAEGRSPDTLPRLLKARIELIRERRRRPLLWRTAVIELCDGMAAELAAGRTPDEAFTATARALDRRAATELLTTDEAPTANACGTPDPSRDTVPAIERLESLAGQRPGAEGLRLLAACWRIGSERGGTLATVLDGLAAALRDEETQRQEIAAQLAGPRATARLLAALPLLGLGMAAALGANPLAFLFGTLPGVCCLTVGVGLDLIGLWWTRRLAQAAEIP